MFVLKIPLQQRREVFCFGELSISPARKIQQILEQVNRVSISLAGFNNALAKKLDRFNFASHCNNYILNCLTYGGVLDKLIHRMEPQKDQFRTKVILCMTTP